MTNEFETIKHCSDCALRPSFDPAAVQVQTYRNFDIDGQFDCQVRCEQCGKEGPYALNRKKAIIAWNGEN